MRTLKHLVFVFALTITGCGERREPLEPQGDIAASQQIDNRTDETKMDVDGADELYFDLITGETDESDSIEAADPETSEDPSEYDEVGDDVPEE